MARTILLVATILWSLGGLAGLVVAAVGSRALLTLLPPLEIDADALGGAITAVSGAVLAIAVIHGAVLAGVRRGHRLALTAGTLLSSLLLVVLLASAATAVTSLVRTPDLAIPLAAAASAALLAAAGYAVVTVALARELGGRPAS
ncbi:MAG: hypothetical protein K5924_11065 [Chloroflexi bacterium]|nr:hypothetical protein [Chloroflexota bacterium]